MHMASRFAKVATAAVTGVALMTQTQPTSYAEKPPLTNPWLKVSGAKTKVDQVGNQVKMTKQADDVVEYFEDNPEALKILEMLAGINDQRGLDAIKSFTNVLKETADAAANAQKETADAAANAQKEIAAVFNNAAVAAANAQKETAAVFNNVAVAAANAQKETTAAFKNASDAAANAHKETTAAHKLASDAAANAHKETAAAFKNASDAAADEVKKTKQANDVVKYFEDKHEALKTLEMLAGISDQYGLDAIKEFASAHKYAADVSADSQKYTADAHKYAAECRKEGVQWSGAAGVVMCFSGVFIVFMMKSIADSFILEVKK
jgi:hypothetical protein